VRYAVIESESNQWVYDGDDEQDAYRHYARRAVANVPCVVVRVLADTESGYEVDRRTKPVSVDRYSCGCPVIGGVGGDSHEHPTISVCPVHHSG
jgi:hypothetical protein